MKTRQEASPGFHQALAAHQAVASPSRVDPSIAETVKRQTAAMRALSHGAFPEPPDNGPTRIETARAQRCRQTAATEAAALRRARAERAGASVPSAGGW
ncbi:hypothetical protein [Streptomyces beigongshangae]|uniref:hypothetical protein n=1 Tax=Streptomyces beigongshangae TaxID=2841597 RepID=UPI001C85B010|nr:hypothetical protein [Streptomyces sp. REN17]